ncbi:MAG: helix-turn-helix domain-containing protein [Actinomycetota bacterium]|nr:helix-turn-helix domain-containing protein [Actinomycetota bacterium]
MNDQFLRYDAERRREPVARYQVGIETKARIIEATRSLLAEGGLDATTLKAICDRAKVRSGSFYNLFGSKEDAIIHVVRESIRAVDPDPDRVGTDTVDDLVDAYSRFLQEEPEMARVYVIAALAGESTGDSARRQFLRHHMRRVERFGDAMQRSDPSLTPEAAHVEAELLLGALDGLAFRWALDQTFDFPKYALLARERFN